MNIYIRIEIRRRELEGRLLLALAAAERGHDVLLGDLDAHLSHRLWLRPGVFHDKSLTPSARKIGLHRRLIEAGFVITSQDEEHGLGDVEYDTFARRRFAPEMLERATGVFCWGSHDRESLVRNFPSFEDRFILTGSPRVDLWRPELAQRYVRAARRPDSNRPIVLITPGSRPFLPHPFWVAVADMRPRQFRGPDDAREWSQYKALGDAYRYTGRLVRAIRIAAEALPDVLFVIRPHPKSPDGAWEAVMGQGANIIVSREGDSAGPWLSSALALVHNGSTTAAEASMMGVPTISFQPHGERSDRFTNRLGSVARGEDELVAHLQAIQRNDTPLPGADPSRDAQIRSERLHDDPFVLAADRIVDHWETSDRPALSQQNHVRRSHISARTHQRIGAMRARARHLLSDRPSETPALFDQTPKFPPLDRGTILGLATGIRESLDRFRAVEVELIGPRLVRARRT